MISIVETRVVRKGIVVVIKNDKSKYLLLKHKKNNLWGLISGGIEPGETKIQATIREAKEEAGLVIDKKRLVDIEETISFVSSKGPGEQRAFGYKLRNSEINVDGKEISEYGWFSKNNVLKNLKPKPPLVELFKKVLSRHLL